MTNRPLEGLLVIALEQAVAAPYCTARLADAGARVIKIERDEGDFARNYDSVVHGESAYFVWLNRGKESITLDIKQPADAALLANMISKADVFVQNLAPGAAARAGFGSDALRARHKRLITCDISGYGETGPGADLKAYDLLVQCESGLASITGAPEAPGRVGVSLADLACGQNAHAAILQALYAREKNGLGAGVAVSLFDGMADWMTVPLLHQDYAGKPPKRVGLNHPSIAPYGAYATGDGKLTVISIQNEREWRSLCATALQHPALAEDARFASNNLRVTNRPALDAEISAVVSKLTRDVFVERLRAANVAYGAVNEVADLSTHPQLRRVTFDTPTGPVALPAPAMRWRGDDDLSLGPTPALGEHSEKLRAEFG
ncbi:CaiB/BaiF CoA transferase family protein [Roseiterribacter gracilis]|uniref:CoA transferase n=1 Tax=Roseiterribacter gracilis TaxID=2812848 RepID=A0A8S8X8R0_9PROT|nr:CoA transferase [Rhodospirillales bacterium TMPK1]